LAAVVKELRADIGISLDGDGDRLVMVDADGEIRDGDEVLYVLALSRLSSNAMRGDVVGTLMTNLGLEIALKEKGIGLSRVNVGDRYILEKLLKEDWVIGGEPSGHIICLDRTTTGDGIVSALQVLAEMNKTGKSLAELCSGMTKYPQVLINVKLGDAVAKEIMQKPQVTEAVAAVEAEMGDSGRVLLRPSGTEPLIRVMVEGSDADQVQRKAEQIADAVRSTL
jgi:phosphoglucosamine mutase